MARTETARGRPGLEQLETVVTKCCDAKGGSPSIRSRYYRVLRTFGEIGVRYVDQINDAAVRRYEMTIGPMKPDARLNLLRDLRTVCDLAVGEKLLAKMPKIPWLREEKPGKAIIPVANSRDTVVQMLAWTQPFAGDTDPWGTLRRHVLVGVVVYTGMLRDDIFDLRLGDIDLEKRTVRCYRRKGNKRADAPQPFVFHRDLVPILEQWLPQTGCDHVFPGREMIGRWYGSGSKKLRAYEEIVQTANAAGIEEPTNFQTLRLFYFAAIDSGEGLDGLFQRIRRRGRSGHPRIVLRSRDESFTIDAMEEEPLYRSYFELLEFICTAFPKGRSGPAIRDKFGAGWWETFKRLMKLRPRLAVAIKRPGPKVKGELPGEYTVRAYR